MVSFIAPALVLSLLAFRIGRIRAQTASCGSEWGWMNNTVGKNPCQIIESLDGWCLGLSVTVQPIDNETAYAPPNDTNSQRAVCDCNSPMYSLFSACAACQGACWVTWSQWKAVCGVAHVGTRPNDTDFFVTTPIPHWAFINVTVNDTFVPGTAKLLGALPEEPTSGPKTTYTLTRSSTQLPVTSPRSTSSSSSSLNIPSVTRTSTPKSRTPVGAIAGGAVGGFAALSVVGFVVLCLCKQRGFKMPTVRKASGPMSLYDPQEGSPDLGSNAIAAERPLLYDPSNPATFPQVNAELERPLHSGGVYAGHPGSHYPRQQQRSSTLLR